MKIICIIIGISVIITLLALYLQKRVWKNFEKMKVGDTVLFQGRDAIITEKDDKYAEIRMKISGSQLSPKWKFGYINRQNTDGTDTLNQNGLILYLGKKKNQKYTDGYGLVINTNNMTQNKMIAPKGKFRVIGVDTFDNTDWIIGDYDTKPEALKKAEEDGGTMLKTHVYDDEGAHVGNYGEF